MKKLTLIAAQATELISRDVLKNAFAENVGSGVD